VEVFRCLDIPDVDAALELYANDAVFLGTRGKPAIRDLMQRGMSANASKRSRHLIANIGAWSTSDDTVVVVYTAAAFTLDGDGPFAARSVFDQRQRLQIDGYVRYRIVEHEIFGYDPR